jgi:hypothetical protein
VCFGGWPASNQQAGVGPGAGAWGCGGVGCAWGRCGAGGRSRSSCAIGAVYGLYARGPGVGGSGKQGRAGVQVREMGGVLRIISANSPSTCGRGAPLLAIRHTQRRILCAQHPDRRGGGQGRGGAGRRGLVSCITPFRERATPGGKGQSFTGNHRGESAGVFTPSAVKNKAAHALTCTIYRRNNRPEK